MLLSRFDPLLYWIVHSQWYAIACLLSVTYSTCQELSFRSLCHAASSRLLSSSTVPKRVRDNDTQESDVDRVGKIMRTCHVSDASTAQVAADTDYP